MATPDKIVETLWYRLLFKNNTNEFENGTHHYSPNTGLVEIRFEFNKSLQHITNVELGPK